MTAIVFRTPGSIDMRAFTTMGVNAKPNTEAPIGYFGTGLKYAVAVLCRLGAQLEVLTGGQRYWFEARPMEFRGQQFKQITMRRDAWVGGEGWRLGRRQKLPFTTMYGRNWEAWMAFRELYSNTLDECGTTEERDDLAEHWPYGDREETLVIVQGCDDFVQAYRDRGSIFVDLGERPVLAALPGLEVRQGETERLFYQGMRAKDLGKPALHTYNFTTGQSLTEDRQLAHEWQVRGLLANTVAACCEDEELIERIVTADEDRWEHGLEPSPWVTPSRAFHNVMVRCSRGVGSSWHSYYGTHDARPEAQKDLYRDSARPWRVDGGDVLAADGTALFSKPFNMNDQHWAALARRVVDWGNADTEEGLGDERPTPEELERGAYVAGYDDGWDDGRDPDSMDPRKDSTARGDGLTDYMSSPHWPGTRGPLPEPEDECPGCLNTVRVCRADRLCERAGAAPSAWTDDDLPF